METKITRFVVGMRDGVFRVEAERCEMAETHNRLTLYIGDEIVGAFMGVEMWARESVMVVSDKSDSGKANK